MTGTELVARIKSRVGGRTDKDVEILQAVNDAIARVSAMHRFDINESTDTIALVDGTATYDLPTGTTAVVSTFLERASGDFMMLEAVSQFRFDRSFKAGGAAYVGYDISGMSGDHSAGDPAINRGQSTGEPAVYAHWGKQIILHPIPASEQDGLNLHVRIATRPTEILTAAESPLGDAFDRVVVAFATADVCAILSLWDDSKGWEARAHMLLREVIAEEKKRPDWTPRSTVAGQSMIR